MKQFERNSKRS